MDTIRRGNIAEAAVLNKLILAGIPVLVPFGEGLPFDLGAAVPPEGRVIRIQVKSGRVRKGCIEFNTCTTDHGKGRLTYRGRADVIAVHIPEPPDVLMVPVEHCPHFRGYFRIDPPKNNQQSGIRFASDYSFEAWVSDFTQS